MASTNWPEPAPVPVRTIGDRGATCLVRETPAPSARHSGDTWRSRRGQTQLSRSESDESPDAGQELPRKKGVTTSLVTIVLRSNLPKRPHRSRTFLSWMEEGHPAANPARHLLTGSSVTVMRSLKNSTALVTGLVGPLGRRVVGRDLRQSKGGTRRESPVGWRCVAAVLALGLGLSGVSPCLCAAEPAPTSDPHACCAHSAGTGGAAPTDGTSVKTSASPCCTSPTAAGLAVRLDDRDVLRHTFAAAVARATAPERHFAFSTLGVSAASLQHFSPPRTTVLRI